MSETVVETIDIARKYSRGRVPVPALNGVSLKIIKSEIIGVIGPSGSGKTTLLNLIGGLDRPTQGRVLVDGVDLGTLGESELADYRLTKIGFVFQFYNLISTLTALENVQMPMSLAGLKKEEQRRRAMDLLRTVGLESRVNHVPDELSGGEQQRVAVARALANNPSIILADEPTGDLDSGSAKVLMELIKTLQKEGQVTFAIVSHDPIVVTQCDRGYAIRDGKIIRELTRSDLSGSGSNDRATMDTMF